MTGRATFSLSLLISGLALLVVAFGVTHDLAPESPPSESGVVATAVDDGTASVDGPSGETLTGACVMVLVCGAIMALRRWLRPRPGRSWVVPRGARWLARQFSLAVAPVRALSARSPILTC